MWFHSLFGFSTFLYCVFTYLAFEVLGGNPPGIQFGFTTFGSTTFRVWPRARSPLFSPFPGDFGFSPSSTLISPRGSFGKPPTHFGERGSSLFLGGFFLHYGRYFPPRGGGRLFGVLKLPLKKSSRRGGLIRGLPNCVAPPLSFFAGAHPDLF